MGSLNKEMPLPELLAPAGSYGIACTALEHGADAVYVGAGRYSLRAQSPGLAVDELCELVELAHARGKRVYVALNTMPTDDELGGVREYLVDTVNGGASPDAFIVSDPGIVRMCRETAPGVALHLSTQTGTFNSEALAFWYAQGVTRVVVPREMGLQGIARLSAAGPMETEAFVHGAMCVSVSGRCLLGAYLSGRHPNRGDCPQPCRLRYRIAPVEGDKAPEWLDAIEDESGTYLLNSCDLNALELLPQIVDTGVAALKIEGRTKSEHYVAVVTGVYREALDACARGQEPYRVRQAWKDELERLEHRPYTTGFYDGELQLQSVHSVKSEPGFRLVGAVRERLGDGAVAVEVKNTFEAGECLRVLPGRPGRASFDTVVEDVRDLKGNVLPRATANKIVVLHATRELRTGDMLRRVTNRD